MEGGVVAFFRVEADAYDRVLVGQSGEERRHGVVGGFFAEEAHYEASGDAESAVGEVETGTVAKDHCGEGDAS